jgi:hypothetical protein
MEDGNPRGLTTAEEAHRLHVHQRHLIEVQYGPGSVTLHACLQCLQTLRLQVADQPERRAVSISLPFNLESHLCGLLSLIGAVDEW